MNIKEYESLKKELYIINERLTYFQNNKYSRPIKEINEIEYHLRQFERESNHIKRKIHLKKSKELIHNLKYNEFITYRCKCKLKSFLF